MSMFKKAERKKAKLRLGLTGPSGSGKTYSALLLARQLGEKIAVIDSENGSASLYTHLCDFDVLELQAPYTPGRFIEAIKAAEEAGYDVLIIDSITHEWSGAGGCLEINEKLAQAKYKGNTWSAWNETTPRHRRLLDTIISSGMHIITTLRSKTETVQGEGKKVFKLGMKSEQRDGFEYELSVVLDITHGEHAAIASKDRTGLFTGKDPAPITDATGKALLAWLNSGPEYKPESQQPPQKNVTPAATPEDVYTKCKQAIETATLGTIQSVANRIMKTVEAGRLSQDDGSTLLALCESQQVALGIPQQQEAPI
jgi:DNA polymerase III delta prime subunit